MTGRWLGVLTALVATTALAQKEQWLEYHTSREGRGYHWLKLSTNAPPGVALPKFNAKPYFVRWPTPMDPAGGRWVCFDRTRKSGPYDRVYVDTKGDGRLDDKTPISANRIEEYSAYFDPARVVFKGEDGPITYHLLFRFSQYERSEAQAYVSSGGRYSGLVDIGGKKRRLELLDNNVNGVFNDAASETGLGDRIAVQDDKAGERYLGKLLEVDGQFYRIEVARDGAFVKLQKAEDLAFGQVRVAETISEVDACGPNGQFVRKPVKGQLSLPAGQYRVLNWTINRKDSKGAAWTLTGSGYGSDNCARFEVAAGTPATPSIGEPVSAVLEADQNPGRARNSGRVVFNLRFEGRSHEDVRFLKGDQRPPGPKLTLASVDGVYRSTNTFEFG